MNFSEKVWYCRKKAGMSQEELAAKLGVSRQAVSKWETGEADPEVSKLKKLADVFAVSVDWLLSEDPPPEEEKDSPDEEAESPSSEAQSAASRTKTQSGGNWLNDMPDFISGMFERFGWLFGLGVAGIGVVFSALGGVLRMIVRRMTYKFNNFAGGIEIHSSPQLPRGMQKAVEKELMKELGGASFQGTELLSGNPVYIMAGVLLIAGIILFIGGVVISIWLYRKSKKENLS